MPYIISITRRWQTDSSTISTYNISNSTITGYILERPGPDTTVSGLKKRIPEGSYNLQWHNSNIPGVSAYNPVPLLFNASVPASRYILIHNGNYPDNTDGCLLVGATKGVNFVGNSVTKLKELKDFINQNGINNFSVTITSSYESGSN